MTLDQVLVTVAGAGGIAFTYWFFLMRNVRAVVAIDSINITVNGGYSPEVIEISNGKTTKLVFTRSDPSSCLEEVVLSDFKVRKHLPLNQAVTIELTPQKTGESIFSCGMNMYHGKVIVKESV